MKDLRMAQLTAQYSVILMAQPIELKKAQHLVQPMVLLMEVSMGLPMGLHLGLKKELMKDMQMAHLMMQY